MPDVEVTETPRAHRTFVADSNIFMERQTSLEPVETARLLQDDEVTLLLAQSVAGEMTHLSEAAVRAFGGQGATIVIEPDPKLDYLDISKLTSRAFNRADLVLVETARIHRLPIVTLNRRLVGQVYDNAQRNALWGTVRIILPPFP